MGPRKHRRPRIHCFKKDKFEVEKLPITDDVWDNDYLYRTIPEYRTTMGQLQLFNYSSKALKGDSLTKKGKKRSPGGEPIPNVKKVYICSFILPGVDIRDENGVDITKDRIDELFRYAQNLWGMQFNYSIFDIREDAGVPVVTQADLQERGEVFTPEMNSLFEYFSNNFPRCIIDPLVVRIAFSSIDIYIRGATASGGTDGRIFMTRSGFDPTYIIPNSTTPMRDRNITTLAHELGHVFGLEHDPDPKNLMYPTAPAPAEARLRDDQKTIAMQSPFYRNDV